MAALNRNTLLWKILNILSGFRRNTIAELAEVEIVFGIDAQGHTILRKAVTGDVIKRQTIYEKANGQLVYYPASGDEIVLANNSGEVVFTTDHRTLPTGLGQLCMDTGVLYYSAPNSQVFQWIAVANSIHDHNTVYPIIETAISAAPKKIGDIAVNAGLIYIATGIASSADWIKIAKFTDLPG